MYDRVGEQFGEYRLARKLGGGTFGDVYLGEHIRDNTPAAIKVLQVRLNNSEDLKDYINEIRSLFRLQHPNIVPLLDFGIERDTPFLIMAYAPNGTLRQPKGTRLPLNTVASYIQQIAEALQCAHDRKLIHRDVKPDNILLGPNGQVWLSDFGIVSIVQSSRSLNTQDGAGTIPYMAPEQILGKPRLASDQYALGIIAYEWICGTRPFNGTAIEIAMQHAQAEPPLLREQVPKLTPAIEQVILRALAKDPKDRFGSVREFAEALIVAVRQAQPVASKTKEQWRDEGLVHRKAGRSREAIEAYTHAIQLDSKYAKAYYNRGNAYRDLEEYVNAIEDYTRAISIDPSHEIIYNNRGNAYRDLEEYTRAIKDYTRAIELDPMDADFYNNRGCVHLELKEYAQAIEDLSRAIELDLQFAHAYNNRGNAYSYQKEYAQAIENFSRAIALDPQFAQAFYSRGCAYSDLKKYGRALRDFSRAIELEPRDANAYNNRGNAYSYLKEYTQAIKDFSRAIELDPKYAKAYDCRGCAHLELREYAQAIEDFSRAIELDPNDADVYGTRGFAYYNLKNYQHAIQNFDYALQLDPHMTWFKSERKDAYRKLGKKP